MNKSTKYYRFSIPSGSIFISSSERAQIENHWFITDDSKVQAYIEEQYMDRPTATVKVKEMQKEDYDKSRRLPFVEPVFEAIPEQGQGSGEDSARQPRTDKHPEVLKPETGNANKDQMINAQQTKPLQRVGMQGSVPVVGQVVRPKE